MSRLCPLGLSIATDDLEESPHHARTRAPRAASQGHDLADQLQRLSDLTAVLLSIFVSFDSAPVVNLILEASFPLHPFVRKGLRVAGRRYCRHVLR